MQAFCFSEYGKELDICRPESSPDFFVLLLDYLKRERINKVVISKLTLDANYWGVKDLLRERHSVIVVDTLYSPIGEKEVLPLHVHRDIATLSKYHDESIIIGPDLISHFHPRRQLASVKTYFQDGGGSYKMDVLTSGWVVRNSSGNATQINSRLYEYVVGRDYELENKNAKRSKRK